MVLSIAAIFVIGVFGPIYITDKKESWGEYLESEIELIENEVLNKFNILENEILNQRQVFKEKIKNRIKNIATKEALRDSLLLLDTSSDYTMILFDDLGEMIDWDYASITGSNFLIDTNFLPGETHFISNNLIEYYSIYDTLETDFGLFTVALYKPLEKKYVIENNYYEPLSLSKSFSDEFKTEFDVKYFASASLTRDGRKYSIPILNNNNNKIGVVTFTKPIREAFVQNLAMQIDTAQSIFAAAFLLLLGLLLANYLSRIKHLSVRFLIIAVYFVSLRFILNWLDFSLLLQDLEISKSKYFSSLFGFGIVSSPLDLFATIFILLVLFLVFYKYSVQYLRNESIRPNWFKFSFSLILFYTLYLLSVRGLGASIKSVIFDSSLRYYKEDSLFPEFIEGFMLLNILLLGFIVFIGTLSFIVIVYKNLPVRFKNILGFFVLFILLQVCGIFFDELQRDPQGTPIFRILFILSTFIALFVLTKNGKLKISYYFGYALTASVLVILLLGQYNSLIEKQSLKKTAYNLTRQNADLLRFAVYETLVEAITDRETVQSLKSEHINPNAIAFKFWSNSILQKESLGSSISILDADHKKIGSFNFRFNKQMQVNWDNYSNELTDLQEIKIFEESIIYSDNKIIRGIATVEDVEGIIGYVTVSVLYDLSSLNQPNAPVFLSHSDGYINDTIEFSKLKIFDFHNGTLINALSNYNLSEKEIITILDTELNEYNEAWVNLSINNEEHLMFILKREQDGISRILAVALKEKELSWGLFDFFKIFFVHLMIIVFFFLVYISIKLFRTPDIKYSFATKLLFSFILISLVPLLLVSVFFRTVTTDKNDYAIEYKLGKRAINVEQYINDYLFETGANLDAVSQKAARDLGIDFTLYKENKFLHSTNDQYYSSGLIPQILNPAAFYNLYVEGMNETVTRESIEEYQFNALYYKTSLLGEYHTIKITDAFNKIMLPLSGQEVDVYIFVSYSVALIIILILGFIFTNQISKPISKLKNATKSVASGDLNVEVSVNTKDEVSELVNGFNYMVRELKRSQAELAEFERETAWKEMAKQVAHEIKNPLTPMKLSVQQLITAYKDKSPKFDALFEKVTNTIINQIETLKNIASEFSAFARMPNPKIEEVNINKLLNEAADLFSEEKVVISVAAEMNVVIASDKDQLRRVFINLIRNSIQADARKVDIKLSKNDYLKVEFIDDGVGIPKEIRERIFENEYSTKPHGMGLGLSMAKKTVENYGGEIFVDESNENGTIIVIKIPLS